MGEGTPFAWQGVRTGMSDRVNFPNPEDTDPIAKTMIVEGWRFLAHSYAAVNQWQLLALLRRADVALSVRDMPLYNQRWQTQDGLFEPQVEQTLRSISTAKADEVADVTLRMFFPYDFSPSHSRQTAIFGTSENQVIRRNQLPDSQAYERLHMMPPPAALKVVTPSRWSAEGFYKAGFSREQVAIVPHGVDIDMFRPMPDVRGRIRRDLRISDNDFVFLSIGSMTGNKGIDLLLQAFTEVSRKFPHARLVLKGMDPLYPSQDWLHQCMQALPAGDQPRVSNRITYFGRSFPHRQMAMLYQAADAYVSPYRAEGFNMPVLEAAACGIPIICTRGGATDDFVTDAIARRIDSRKVSINLDGEELAGLEPNVEHLIGLMVSAVKDASWRNQAAEAGPLHVRANYTWDRVVGLLVRNLFN